MKKQFVLLFIIGAIFTAEAQNSAMKIADSLYLLGNYNKAIQYYKKDSLLTYNQLKIAQSFVNQTAYNKAIPYYEKVVYKDSTQFLATYELAKLYYKTKQIPRAINYFDWLQKKDTKNPNYPYFIGVSLEQLNQPNYIKQYQKAIVLDEAHLKSLKKLAKYYLKKDDWIQFSKYINLGLKHYPDNLILLNYQAQAFFKQQYYSKSIDVFSRIEKIDPKNKFVVSKLGQANHALKKYEVALGYYKKALKLDKDNGNFHTQIGLLYKDTQEYKKAYYHYFIALRVNKVMLDEEHYNIAMLFKEQKKYEQAIKQLKLALKENQYNHKAHFELAICADNFYKDDKEKLRLYKVYKLSFEGKNKRFDGIVKERMSSLKEKIHIEGLSQLTNKQKE